MSTRVISWLISISCSITAQRRTNCLTLAGPRDALFYPIRCVSDFLPAIGVVERALDLGCAVGRSTFELSRWADRKLSGSICLIGLSPRQTVCERQDESRSDDWKRAN